MVKVKHKAFLIKFDKQYLNELIQDSSTGVTKELCKYHIAVHPAQLNNFGQSIKDELDQKVAKYNKAFKGILLGYENLKLDTDLGRIGMDNCYIHMNLLADYFVFKPEVDMVLKGIVIKTTQDHVGCLVYNTFNISLPKSECKTKHWIGHDAKIGDEVEFRITYIDFESRLLYVRGEILSIVNSAIESFSSKDVQNKIIKFDDDELNSTQKKSKKKQKKHQKTEDIPEFEDQTIKTETTENSSSEVITKPKKTKKDKKQQKYHDTEEEINMKKQKRREKKLQETEDIDLNPLFEETIEKKKKRKRSSASLSLSQERLEEDMLISPKIEEVKEEITIEYHDVKEALASQDFEADSKKENKKKRKRSSASVSQEIKEEIFYSEDKQLSSNFEDSERSENKKKRKRSASLSQSFLEEQFRNIKQEPETDIENSSGKKRKKSKSISMNF